MSAPLPCLFRFDFDPGSGCCLWSANEAARARFDYGVDHHALPLTENTRRWLDYLIAWYDTSLDWSALPAPAAHWSAAEDGRFRQAAAHGLALLRAELPAAGFAVEAGSGLG